MTAPAGCLKGGGSGSAKAPQLLSLPWKDKIMLKTAPEAEALHCPHINAPCKAFDCMAFVPTGGSSAERFVPAYSIEVGIWIEAHVAPNKPEKADSNDAWKWYHDKIAEIYSQWSEFRHSLSSIKAPIPPDPGPWEWVADYDDDQARPVVGWRSPSQPLGRCAALFGPPAEAKEA